MILREQRLLRRKIRWLTGTCGLLTVLLLALAIFRHSSTNSIKCVNRSGYTGLDQSYKIPRAAFRLSPFSSPNLTIALSAWESIMPGYGVVAVDREWAMSKKLPDTMPLPQTPALPSDGNKLVYTLEAYHEIHCLKSIQQNFMALHNGEELKRPVEHLLHCFDALRQHIQCHADDTLLRGWGDTKAGFDQPRKCRDWGALREWAADRPACYLSEPPDGLSFWGHCGKKTDGLII